MGKTTTKKSWLEDLTPLKVISGSTKLPYVFDLHWDIKDGRDLWDHIDSQYFDEICRYLAEHSYDVNEFKEQIRKYEIQKTVNVIDYFGGLDSFTGCSGVVLPNLSCFAGSGVLPSRKNSAESG